MKKAADSFMDSSRARHDLQGDEMENQRRTKSDSKQQATKNHMTKKPKAYEFSLKKKKKKKRGGERICLQCGRPEFDPWVGKIPWRREWLPTLVFLPQEFHRQRSLVGYNP